MAKLQPYTDPTTQQVYPDAYWRPTQVNISFGEKRAHILFQAYVSQAARQSGEAPIPGAIKEYDLRSNNEFDAWFGDNSTNLNVRQVAYAVAQSTHDCRRDDRTIVSFFENATDLL